MSVAGGSITSMAIGTPARADPDTIETIELVRRLARRATAGLDGSLEELGLTSAGFFLLRAIAGAPREHVAALARSSITSRQAADRVARQLIRTDLVRVEPVDLGVRGLVVTQAGERRLELAMNAVASVLAPIEHALDPAERRALASAAERAAIALHPRPRPWWFD